MFARWRKLSRSTIAQFVLLLFLVQLSLTLGALYFEQRSSEQALLAEQQSQAAAILSDLSSVYRSGGTDELALVIRDRLQNTENHAPVLLLVDPQGKPIAGNLGAWPPDVTRPSDWRMTTLYRTGADRPETMGVIAKRLPGGEYLLTGTVLDEVARLQTVGREAMLGALALAAPVALLLAILLGRLISNRLKPIVDTAGLVGKGQLTHRVPLDGSGDTFDDLANRVNAMLDQIESSVGELRIVTDGLAHDLRSPITRLKSTLERAIIETDDTVAQTALAKVAAEADNLLGMLSLALQISRAEAGIGRDRFTVTNVGMLLSDLVEIYGPVVEDQGWTLTGSVDQEIAFPMHRELVSQALGNLVENALKYADGAQSIHVEAAVSDGMLAVSVADDGKGIPPEKRDEARQRFMRLDPSRHVQGSGLGLSLVEAVAKLHGGSMQLEDNAPGLRVVFTLSA